VEDDLFFTDSERPPDPTQARAQEQLEAFFAQSREAVFFSRQIEVRYEDEFFHWITNRALRELIVSESLRSETRQLTSGGAIKLIWHRSYRYYRRSAAQLVQLVEQYADPNIGGALGLHAEALVLEGFARCEFVMKGRNTRRYEDREWRDTDHDLDFIFERDGIAYGIEVKNTLGYIDYEEFDVKIDICHALGGASSVCRADATKIVDPRIAIAGRVRTDF
jgi:hypothetical protein